ncbi:MAG: hypothetical protein NW200_13855 [Hyphomonadaceae bacterium]|nr:hypothetical protein [Hyphomonadaceae bacterium]
MTGFWKSWMTIWCWMTLGFGVLFAGAATPATDAGARLFFDIVDGARHDPALFDDPAMRFAQGLIGAIMIGWAMTLFTAVRAADLAGPAVWRGLTGAVIVWYAIDSAISVGTGFPINAVTNTLFVAGFLAPVVGSGVLRAHARAATA